MEAICQLTDGFFHFLIPGGYCGKRLSNCLTNVVNG